VEVTREVTPDVPEAVTAEVQPAELPTALPFPTLPPAVATFDDGAPDWSHSANWQLQPHDSGLAWVMSGSATTETLRWPEALDLREVSSNVALTFQSQLLGVARERCRSAVMA